MDKIKTAESALIEKKAAEATSMDEKKSSRSCFFLAALSRANALSAGCIFCGRFFLAWGRIFLAESFHASGSVENFLLAGVERMAGGTYLNADGLAQGGTGGKNAPAGTFDGNVFVLGMALGFHD